MAYVGNSPNYQNFAVDTFNGGGASHTLTYTPGSAAALLVFVDGVHQKATTDYTVSGTTLTPTTAWPSGTGNVIVIYLGRSADVGTPSDGTISAAKLAATAISGQTEDTSPDHAADYLLSYDASAGTLKKVLLARAGALTFGTSASFPAAVNVDVTIPSGAKRITFSFAGLSYNNNASPAVQIGDSGGIEATSYTGAGGDYVPTANFNQNSTHFFMAGSTPAGTAVYDGVFTLTLIDSSTNTWAFASSMAQTAVAWTATGAGAKSLSGELTTVRFTSFAGTASFDAGKYNVLIER
jgi:hypothetical protein